jgi:hypothetical protein
METETALEIVISLFVAAMNYCELVKSSSLYERMQQDLFVRYSVVTIAFGWIDVRKLL